MGVWNSTSPFHEYNSFKDAKIFDAALIYGSGDNDLNILNIGRFSEAVNDKLKPLKLQRVCVQIIAHG
jgi:hypothetical protein